jgi:hypothetical protein
MTNHLARIISAIKEFDAHDSILDHDRLEVKIPSGFFRFDSTTQHPSKAWDSVDVRMSYSHKVLQFSVELAEQSQSPSVTITANPRRKSGERELYGVKESIRLSIKDARMLLAFLQRYCCCFDFFITTKLLR